MARSQPLPQLVLLDRIATVFQADQGVRAAFLRGSFYTGQPDLYSDLDVFIVAAPADASESFEHVQALLAEVGTLLWVSHVAIEPPQLRVLFPGPVRLDLTVVTTENIPPYDGWRVLFDKHDLLGPRSRVFAADPLRPEHVAMQCDEFWWHILSSVGQLKRGNLWMALSLLDTCRTILAQMMRWRRDPERPFERYVNLEQHLTVEDQQALAQTLANYDVRSITLALLSAADAFDPAGREVALRVGATYPAELAQTTKAYFIHEFWSLIASGPAISA